MVVHETVQCMGQFIVVFEVLWHKVVHFLLYLHTLFEIYKFLQIDCLLKICELLFSVHAFFM